MLHAKMCSSFAD